MTQSTKKSHKITINIPVCTGSRYVISDIHGCLKTFTALVEKINLKKQDQLFLLGDYIDKGPDSKGVLDFIINLSNTCSVFALRGNHEEDFEGLIEINSERLFNRHIQKRTNSLLNNDYSVDEKYQHFISNLPYYFELENHYLVHAGFDFNQDAPFLNTYEMLWIRTWDYDIKKAKNKSIIHGHDVNNISDIKEKINRKEKIIPLDNGCVFADIDGYGNLLCLNIDTYELYIQENIEY